MMRRSGNMNIAVVGDVHLHLRKYAEFEANRFSLLIDTLIQNNHDKVIFAGDLLDHARPTLEEQKLLQEQINKLSLHSDVYILSGNHEAVTTDTSTYDYWIPSNATIVNNTKNLFDGIDTLSWSEAKAGKATKGNVLISHLRANMGIIKEEYDIKDLGDRYELVILGDIHKRYSPYSNVHYTSSPYSTKFSDVSFKDYGYIQLVGQEPTPNGPNWSHEDIILELPCKVKRSCEFKDVQSTLDGLEKHLVRLEVSGSLEELQTLDRLDNVEYVKSVNINQVEPHQKTQSTDIVQNLKDTLQDDKVLQAYDNHTVRITSGLQKIKEKL